MLGLPPTLAPHFILGAPATVYSGSPLSPKTKAPALNANLGQHKMEGSDFSRLRLSRLAIGLTSHTYRVICFYDGDETDDREGDLLSVKKLIQLLVMYILPSVGPLTIQLSSANQCLRRIFTRATLGQP